VDAFAFVTLLDDVIRGVRPDLLPSSRKVAIAHAALESGWGEGAAARNGFNYWNVTAGPSWTGATSTGPDQDGAGKPITQTWRAYGSPLEAAADYFQLLSWSRYRPALAALEAGKSLAFVQALGSGGYYTLNPALYWARFEVAEAKVNLAVVDDQLHGAGSALGAGLVLLAAVGLAWAVGR
jgi:hypothetical protein